MSAYGPSDAAADWAAENQRVNPTPGPVVPSVESMSLRDYFAAQVLAATADNDETAAEIVDWAYLLADAMLKERAK